MRKLEEDVPWTWTHYQKEQKTPLSKIEIPDNVKITKIDSLVSVKPYKPPKVVRRQPLEKK